MGSTLIHIDDTLQKIRFLLDSYVRNRRANWRAMSLKTSESTRTALWVGVLALAGCDRAAAPSNAAGSTPLTEPTVSIVDRVRTLDDSFQLIVKGNVTWDGFRSHFDPQNYRAAQKLLERLVNAGDAQHTDDPVALNNLGVLLALDGQFEQARPMFERAIRAAENQKNLAIEPIVLAMTVGNERRFGQETGAVPYTSWLSVVRVSGGPSVTYRKVWREGTSPNMFASGNWYAKELATPAAERLLTVLRGNARETRILETNKFE